MSSNNNVDLNYSRNGVRNKQRQLNSKGTKIKKMFGITFLKAALICIISFIVLGFAFGIGVFKGILSSAPDISTLDVTPSGYATVLYDCEGHEMTKLVAADSNRTYVSMDKIPSFLGHAFVAIEDERFYEHNGIDIKGIMRAGVIAVTSKSLSQGASTITQQLIKNNVFDQWASGESTMEKVRRKIQEQYLAIELEKIMTKDQILELYMNSINLGQNTLGVQAASLRYFNKPVYELTISEAAVIAGITQNPSKYNPITHPDKNAERREKVLKNMYDQKFITKAEYDEAIADDVYSRIQVVNTQVASSSVYTYFVDELIEQIIADLTEKFIQDGYTESQASTYAYNQLYSGGLSIYTTQDPQIQSICDEVYSDPANYPEHIDYYLNYQVTIQRADGTIENISTEKFKAHKRETLPKFNLLYPSEEAAYEDIQNYLDEILEDGDEIQAENISLTPQPQVSLTVMDPSTGYVVALIGGRGVKETSRSLNRATNTTRQPGSCFKVLAAYAPAFDSAGMTLADVFLDAPYNYSNGRPISNWYGNSYKGICTLRYGVEQSLNIIAVKTITKITPQLAYDYLINFGFTTLVDRRVYSDGSVHSDINQSLALGGITDGVTNMELTAAYATIANGGVYMEPILYTKIVDHDGNVLLDKTQTQETRRVLKESTSFLLTSAMVDVVTKGTGGRAAFPGMAIAGKTGTTSDNKDVWFAGYTPYYAASTWTGYDNNTEMTSNTGTNLSKTMWKTVMQKIHEGLDYKSFDVPQGVTSCTVCSKSGKKPIPGVCDGHTRTEYFAEGTLPTEECDVHYQGTICAYSHMKASEQCPFKMGGTLELTPGNDLALQGTSVTRDENGNIINTNASRTCAHNAAFFADPNYLVVLAQQYAELTALGLNFDMSAYVPQAQPQTPSEQPAQ